MKLQLLTSAITALANTFICTLVISSTTTYATPQPASFPTTSKADFSCQTVDGVPATVAHTFQGTTPVIRWVRKYYPESSEDPITRCVRVSGIFQTYNQQGILNYITTGEMNGQRVICAASKLGSPCSRLLYILEPDENPDKEVRVLRSTIGNPLSSPTESRDSRRGLGVVPRDDAPPVPKRPGLSR